MAVLSDIHGVFPALEAVLAEPEGSNHLLGLLRFKVGTGGEVAEYLGEWDLPLNRLLHKALDLYMSRR